jgi:hypothetical protein
MIVLCAFASFGTACRGQAAPQPPKTVVVHRYANVASLSSLPDWAGIWTFDFPTPGGPPPEVPSLTRASAAELKVLQGEEAKNQEPATESANCLPPGMPTIMFQPYDIEFLFTPGRVTIIQEAYMQVRRVFTDGRGHPADLDPTFNGHSIGHWEGDTLVIDVTGLNDKTWFDRAGNFHSDALHVVERYTPLSPDALTYEVTIEDPKVFSRPWKMSMPLYRRLDKNAQLMEFKCVEFVEELMYGHLRKQPSK